MKTQESKNHISRLTIDVPTEFHRVIKAHATLENHSIKEYVVDAIKEKLRNDNKNKAEHLNVSKAVSDLKHTLNKRTISVLKGASKTKKISFQDTSSAMKYLTK